MEELLDRYQDLIEAGRVPSLDELCRDCPDLRAELARRIDRLHRVGQLLDDPSVLPVPDLPPLSLSDDKTWVSHSNGDTVPIEIPAPPGYEAITPLGEGGMGIVYKARQVGLNRLVALKMILAGTRARAVELARFRYEAQSIAALRHPNIVQVFETGEFRGQPFFSLEFCAGGTLAKALGGEPQPPRVAARMIEVLARAIHYAHTHGIVHRDLKPSNVLLSADFGTQAGEPPTIQGEPAADSAAHDALRAPQSTLKITDFGLAKRVDDDSARTQDGSVIGTPSYMAPEQAFGKTNEIGPLADVHALGAMLYEFLTGRPPFKGSTVHETLEQVRHRDPVPVRQLQPKVPIDLETICLKCLQKDVRRRYSSAEALADDLGRFLAGRPIKARPVGQIDRAWRWCQREPRTAVLVAATGALASLLAAVIGWYGAELGSAESLLAEHEHAAAEAIRAENAARESEEAQRYFAATSDAGRLRAAARPGWTWQARQRIETAAASTCPARDPVALRTELAAALAEVDVRPAATVARGLQAGMLAFLPDGRLAVAPQLLMPLNPFGFALLIDPRSQTEQKLPLPPVKPVPDKWSDASTAFAVSPDGRWLVLGLRGGTVIQWDLRAKPQPTRRDWKAHAELVSGVAFSPDSSWLFTAGHDGQVKRWAAAGSRKPEATWRVTTKPGSAIHGISYWPTPRAGILAHGTAGTHLLDLLTLSEITPGQLRETGWAPPSLGVTSARLAVHPATGLIVTGAGGELAATYWERSLCLRTTRFVDRGLGNDDTAHSGKIEGIALHPSGTLLASACPSEGMVKIWHVPSGELAVEIPIPNCRTVAFAADGRQLAVGGDHVTALFEVGGIRTRIPMLQRGLTVRAMAVAADGSTATLASRRNPKLANRDCVVATVWDGDGHVRETVIHRADAGAAPGRECIATSSVGEGMAFVCSDGTITWRDPPGAASAALRARKAGPLADLAIDPAGRCWTIEDTSLSVWPASGSEKPRAVPLGRLFAGRPGLECVRVGRKFALVGSDNGYLRIVQADTGALLRECSCFDESPSALVTESANTVRALDVSADESQAVAGTEDGRLWLFRPSTGEKLFSWPAHSDRVTTVAMDPSGQWLASGSRDRTVRLWKRAGDQYEAYVTLELRHAGAVRQVLFTRDGNRLLVLHERESAVCVWHLQKLHEAFRAAGLD